MMGRAGAAPKRAEAVQMGFDRLWGDERADAPSKAPTTRYIDGGRLAVAPLARERVHAAEVHRALGRHLAGDWGHACPEDRAANEEALRTGGPLFSVHETRGGTAFWVITEADRSSTRVLLPEEYRPAQTATSAQSPSSGAIPLPSPNRGNLPPSQAALRNKAPG